MKTYSVYLPAVAGASYEVQADSEEEAIEKAWDLADLDDCEAAAWDGEADDDVTEVTE